MGISPKLFTNGVIQMQKITALILCVVLAFVFASCGKKNTTDTAKPSTTTSTTRATTTRVEQATNDTTTNNTTDDSMIGDVTSMAENVKDDIKNDMNNVTTNKGR